MKPLLLLLGTIVVLAGCARANEGNFVANYQAQVFETCQRALPYREGMSDKRHKQFCGCASEAIARRFTVAELQRFDKLPADPALDKRVDAIFAQCAGYAKASTATPAGAP